MIKARKTHFRRLRRIAAGALLALASLPAAASEDREVLAGRLAELRAEIARIQQQIDADLGRRDSALEALASAEREVSRVERERRQTAADLADVAVQIGGLEIESESLQQRVGDAAQALGRQLALAYRQGAPSQLKLLLNQDDPRRINRSLAYQGYLTRARLSSLEALNSSLADLESNRQQLDEEREALARLDQRQLEQLGELESARTQRAAALSELDRRIRSGRQTLQDLERDAQELTALIARLADALADIPPDVAAPSILSLRGQLPHPINGRLRQGFGDSRGGELRWNGWLLAASIGTEVRAIAHGRVAYADWLRGYGLILIIEHGEGFMSLYAHNDALLRTVGDWVGPGDVIATVGNSGGVSEAGLYFELRRDGQPVNPAAWLVRR